MRPDALLVNTARGGLIDEEALFSALSSGSIAAAALDVFDKEPPANSPLLALPNVLVSAHMASYTREAMENMSNAVAGQLLQVHRGMLPTHLVNPEALDARGGSVK